MTRNNKIQNRGKQPLPDTAKLKSSDKIIVEADKTNNVYLVDAAEYKKLIKDNITKSYKKCEINEEFMIDQKSAILAKRLDLDDRIQKIAPKACSSIFPRNHIFIFLVVSDRRE